MIYINGKYEDISFRNKIGELHRVNKPAFIHRNNKTWYENGKLHNMNGPSHISSDRVEYYIKGEWYPSTRYYEKLKEMGLE